MDDTISRFLCWIDRWIVNCNGQSTMTVISVQFLCRKEGRNEEVNFFPPDAVTQNQFL